MWHLRAWEMHCWNSKEMLEDLSPVYLTEIICPEGRDLRFLTPIAIVPTFDAATRMVCLEYPPFRIDLAAPTRGQVTRELLDVVHFLWQNYALAPDDSLSVCARRLKQALLSTIEECQ